MPPGQPGGFFFGREGVLPFFFDVGALRGMSSNIDAIGTSRTRRFRTAGRQCGKSEGDVRGGDWLPAHAPTGNLRCRTSPPEMQ
jgi:hypothetical protein